MKPTDRLPFTLHAFRRITWVNELLKAEWESRIENIPQHAGQVFTKAAAEGILPIYMNNVSAGNLYEYKKKMYANGLHAEQLSNLPVYIQQAFVLNPEAESNFVISGKRREVINFIENMDDPAVLEEIAALPPATLTHWKEFANSGLEDIQWAYLSESCADQQSIKVFENNMINPCWRKLGIAAIPHSPASMQCEKSLALAAQLRSLAQDMLSPDDYSNWYEVLSWPAEWTALHGIAEIKTPLFKMVNNTDATASKYTVRYLSDSYPARGMHGLLFPYKAPAKLHVSSSEKFRKGLVHINKSAGLEEG